MAPSLPTEKQIHIRSDRQHIDGLSLNSNGNQNQRTPLTLIFGVMVSKLAQPNAKFQVSTSLRFSGAQRIAILAYGKTTHLDIDGDWPNPAFDGGFLPVKRTVFLRRGSLESGRFPGSLVESQPRAAVLRSQGLIQPHSGSRLLS